jgi:4-hydroxy-tetrahydrodipicolinate reductase
MEMITVGIAGAAGRMGCALVRAVAERPDLRLARAWERAGHPAAGQDAGTLAGLGPLGVALAAGERPDLAGCQVIIDFTVPAASASLAPRAAEAGSALVVGTTGLAAGQVEVLRAASARVPVIYATNFSVGVNLLWQLARLTAAALGESFDAEIIEAHHNQKADAPSGTAVTLFEEVCRGRGLDPATAARHGRQGQVGPRTRAEVGLHAVRGGDIVGDHTVLFAGPGERLELKHQAHSRDTFAKGAARAAAWVAGRPAGWYRVADVLGLNSHG